jgi:hypothetical protein
MLNQDQTIPCPICGTKIPFDTNQLIMGVQFSCPNTECDASIGLAGESKEIVKETMEKFETFKGKISDV